MIFSFGSPEPSCFWGCPKRDLKYERDFLLSGEVRIAVGSLLQLTILWQLYITSLFEPLYALKAYNYKPSTPNAFYHLLIMYIVLNYLQAYILLKNGKGFTVMIWIKGTERQYIEYAALRIQGEKNKCFRKMGFTTKLVFPPAQN